MKYLLFILPVVFISCVKELKLDIEDSQKMLVLESVSYENEGITACVSIADFILNPSMNISDVLQKGKFTLTRLTDNLSVTPDSIITEGDRSIIVFPMIAEKGHLYKMTAEHPDFPKVEIHSGEIQNALSISLLNVDSIENSRSTNAYGPIADSSYLLRLKIFDNSGITGNCLRLFADIENSETENGFTITEKKQFQPVIGELYTNQLFYLNFSKPFSYIPETSKLNFHSAILYDASYDGGSQILEIKVPKNGVDNLKTDCCLSFFTSKHSNFRALIGSTNTKSIEYLFSVYQNYYSNQNQFSTASQIKNNAKNGYGTFAIFSQDEVKLNW
ncbi:MAG: DUF4249 family protein [Bacteroidetes bacterium]|nr:DUF4249 family protein [Bacteroidota bacterium]